MPKKTLLRAIRVPATTNSDGSTATDGYVIDPADKKWESKLNDAGLDKKAIKRLEDKGYIATEGDDEDGDEPDATDTPVHDLQAVVDGLDDPAEIRKLRRKDKRVSAKPIYDARLEALKEAEKAEG